MNIKNNYNLPARLERSDYEKCVDLVKKEAFKNPTISSVYLMGGEWCPGISDLDIVAFYKDGLIPQPLSSPWSLSEKARFIFTHRYLSFNQSSARYFYFLYPSETANLHNLIGKEQEFLAIPNSNRQWGLAFILFDILVNKLLLFRKFKKSPKNIRQLLGSLYSLTYTTWMVREISGVAIDDGFEDRIKKLRQNWFALDEGLAEQELMSLLDDGVILISRAVIELDRFVTCKISENIHPRKLVNEKFAIKFTARWSHQKFIKEFDKSLIWDSRIFGKKIESFRLLLPLSFSIFLQAYAQGEGRFSRIIHQHLGGFPEGEKITSLDGHVKAVNLAFESSLASEGLFKIPYAYGFSTGKRKFRSKLFWKSCSLLRDIR